jgi:sensor domain CHASE-containing protein
MLQTNKNELQQDPAFLSAQEIIKRSEKLPNEGVQIEGFF